MQQEPLVHERMQYLGEQLKDYQRKDTIIRIEMMWSAFACDVISEYSYGFHYNQLGSENFADSFHQPMLSLIEFGGLSGQFPWLSDVRRLDSMISSVLI